MPQISKEKQQKISEQILYFLFTISPESRFTSEIAKEIARDEEYTKKILLDLKKNSLIIEINKNSKGTSYIKRQRWRLSKEVFQIYKNRQQ